MGVEHEFHRMGVEHEEVVWATTKYGEDLFNCKNELKEAKEMVRRCNNSIFVVENKREHAWAKRDKVGAELEKAQGGIEPK